MRFPVGLNWKKKKRESRAWLGPTGSDMKGEMPRGRGRSQEERNSVSQDSQCLGSWEQQRCLLNLSPSLLSATQVGACLRSPQDKTPPAPRSALFLPESLLFSVQPALWPTLAALALLSCVTEASLDPMSRSPAARDGPSPVLAPPTDHLPGR